MYEEQFRTRQWSGWWYLERRARGLGGIWGDWGHVAANPNRLWLTCNYPEEVRRAAYR